MSTETTAVLSERIAHRGVRVFSAAVLVFLVAPILIIVPLSFNQSSYFSYPLTGLTLGWYELVLGSPEWRMAILNSFVIGLSATAIATALGTLAAIGISRPSFPLRGVIVPILIAPMIIPIVVVAVSLYLVFAPLGLTNTHSGVILAHAALGTPFVVITVTARLMAFDTTLSRAAASLGATPWEVFRRVMLPQILPGVATGSIFAFATSFDEVVVILFIGGTEQRTIPRQMWAGIRDQINPGILAMAGLLTVFAVVLFLLIGWLQGRSGAPAR
ncbi:ABC transporter permease [Lichenifustis flavocetrariae]|uniref:ABC transporter permease n=1 Tax=Lichenifustis flavocetrariae TaxID=2949735 RepID=A0AA41YTQ3_9HYPH|nr:ABC transporter permease [Lichenifustis flavocetrariae]MCW6508406.1 ABC transporter permease [Lichenifustis flavocetrariae]